MEDPLEELSGLSLFSHNLAMKPARYTDPDSTHLFIKSLELGNSSKYLEQVKSNVDILSSKELLNQEIADNPIAKKEDEAVAGNEREASRVRRPGLGRKKAKFSMVPKSSQPSLSSEFIPDAELSKDPREFFAYFDRREVAEKELKRLRGESVIDDEIDFSLPIPQRQRRPGILGKTATYKHLYPSSTLPETNDTSMSSQKALEDVIISLVKPVLEPESVDPPIGSEKNQTESIAVSEDKIGKLFEELFSSKNLDKDGISSTMMDRLQIKSSIMDEIPVPSFQVTRNDTKTRRALSSIQNIPQTVGGKTPAKDKQIGKTLSQALASSRPSSSPLAPISAFQKHIRQSNLWNDHFSSFELSPPKNSSPVDVDERSDRLDIELNDSTFGNLASPEIITDISVKDQFSKPEMSTDADFGIEDGNEVVTNVDDVAREAISPQVKENVETSSRVHTDFQTAGTDESNENVDDVAREAISPQVKENVETSSRVHSDFQTAGTDESNENVEGMFQNADFFNSDVSTAEKVKSNGHRADIINDAATETCNNAESIPMDYNQVDEPSEIPLNETTVEISKRSVRKTKEVLSSQTLAEKQSDNPRDDQSNVEALPKNGRKKVTKKPLGVPLNDQTNGVAPPKSRKRKDFSRRSSLAAAGSHWEEGGLRRSSRITTKPLKYWKGERFVYGRVHESLATVIGLKYDSPGQGDENSFEDKRNLKVKSFVSEELKELVMRRSLY